jgi:transposase-like protein
MLRANKLCSAKIVITGLEDTLLKNVKFTAELISLTLDLYFSGLSLRKMARNINDHFEIEVDFTTIYNRIKRYAPIISEYVNSLIPTIRYMVCRQIIC